MDEAEAEEALESLVLEFLSVKNVASISYSGSVASRWCLFSKIFSVDIPHFL